MFTAEQLQAAHGKVKSGADFPAYIQEIGLLGVTAYVFYVTDGHTDYHGADGHIAKVAAKYPRLAIAETVQAEKFEAELKAHQRGETDFFTFIAMCAACGIEKWIISMEGMTCIYYDSTGREVLAEVIPQPKQ